MKHRSHKYIGQRFGRLVVEDIVRQGSLWVARCRCDCGNIKNIQKSNLYNKNSGARIRSCGCLNKEVSGARFRTHGSSKTKEFEKWMGMRRRCSDEFLYAYPRYGGRGIKVCERWSESFENFLEDMGPLPTPHHSIERIDPNGNYCPENCCWIHKSEQPFNKECSIKTSDGVLLGKLARDNGLEWMRARSMTDYWDVTASQIVDFLQHAPRRTRIKPWFKRKRGIDIRRRFKPKLSPPKKEITVEDARQIWIAT